MWRNNLTAGRRRSGEGGGSGQTIEEGLRWLDGEEVQISGGYEEHGAELPVVEQETAQVASRTQGLAISDVKK